MAVTNFIPQLWSARLLEHLDKDHVYANLVNRDYEGEISNYGDTVKVNQIADVKIKDYTKNTPIADADLLDGTQATLTIDQAKYFNFGIDDIDNAQSNPKLMDEAMARAAYGMNDVTDKFLAGIMAAGAGSKIGDDSTPIVPTKDTAYDYLVDLATALTEANVPMAGRFVVIPAWYHGMLLKDARFVGNGTDANMAALQGGIVGAGAGFTIAVSNNVPETSGAKYKIVAGTSAGCSFAEQILEVEGYRPEKAFSDAIKGLHVYGGKVFQPKALAVMTANKK